MSRWFRMYEELLNDPKAQCLSGDDFKAWVNLLCLASQNGGILPANADVAFALRCSLNDAVTVVERLVNGGLLDKRNGGINGYHYAPHGWEKRQFKSDTSTARVKRYRERSKAAAETPPETETETDISVAKATGPQPDSDQVFWDGAKGFLRPESKNPGALVGKWCRDHGKEITAQVITRAQLERPAQRIPFIEGAFRARARDAPAEYQSPC